MIDRERGILPITKQAQVLRISRGSVDDLLTCPVPEADSAIMRRLNQLRSGVPLRRLADVCEACWLPRGARSAVGM